MVFKVDSSWIEGIAYDNKDKILHVKMQGKVYEYENVPKDLVIELVSADSVGQFFNYWIKGLFENRKAS